jgi:hypothetical protein
MPTIKLANGLDVKLLNAPPDDFDPMAADQDTLLAYGYPRRPEDPVALARWRQVLGKPLRFITPTFKVDPTKRHRPANRVTAGTTAGSATSPVWSGAVVFAPTSSMLYSVWGTWIVPAPLPAKNDGTWYYSAVWVGIDGDASPDVFQAGVECEAMSPASGPTQTRIYAWWEWFPENEVQITNFPVSAGDKISCIMTLSLPYESRILEVGTTFAPETDGTWLMADYDRDGIPDLVFIKTANTGTGKVEVHIASGASKYQTRILEVGTTFAPETDGTWLMADYDRDGIPDLVFIKTSNTGTGKVEVHVASGASHYQTRILEVGTTFAPETDGTWLMADYDRDGIPDLVFIKTSNTGTGMVEIHIASGASNYQTRILEVATTFAPENDGTWCMSDYNRDGIPDIVFVKTSNTGTGTVEVHVASGAGSMAFNLGSVMMRNETQGSATAFQFSAPQGTRLVGNCAEWIVERPGINGTTSNLANYGTVEFTGADALTTFGKTLEASAGDTLDMLDGTTTISTGTASADTVTCKFQ